MTLVRCSNGNSHVGREQLFENVDGYYSLCYSNPRGNVRSFYQFCSAGARLDTPVAQFRLKSRTEIAINWFHLNPDGVITVIGKFEKKRIRNREKKIETYRFHGNFNQNLGGLFWLWKESRTRDTAEYVVHFNDDFGAGHLSQTVLPNMVNTHLSFNLRER